MRALPSMNSHMPVEFSGMFKCSRTNLTFVGSFFGMDASMNAEVFLYTEAFIAEFASEKNEKFSDTSRYGCKNKCIFDLIRFSKHN